MKKIDDFDIQIQSDEIASREEIELEFEDDDDEYGPVVQW